jgi:hypothetical protein
MQALSLQFLHLLQFTPFLSVTGKYVDKMLNLQSLYHSVSLLVSVCFQAVNTVNAKFEGPEKIF